MSKSKSKTSKDLIKEGMTVEKFRELRDAYKPKDFINIIDDYKHNIDSTEEVIKKLVDKIKVQFAGRNVKKATLIEKIKSYQKKYDIEDVPVEQLLGMIMYGDDERWDDLHKSVPVTRISSVLGTSHDDKLTVPEGSDKSLREILSLRDKYKMLHGHVALQASTYTDSAPEVFIGEYNQAIHKKYDHIHPIIAALFVPKIKYLEDRIIFASIANIVYNKYNKRKLETAPEYSLFYDMVYDPNDIVCDQSDPYADLLSRVKLQEAMWESILELRQGSYYSLNQQKLLDAIDMCKFSVYDAPDLTEHNDDGKLLRKIMAAFSMRPIVVNTQSVPMNLPIDYTSNFYPRHAEQEITTIPMVNLYLPPAESLVNSDQEKTILNLSDSLNQYQWFVDKHKNLVPKYKSLVHNQGLLVFYVNRKYHKFNINKFIKPFNFNALPHSFAGYDKLNNSRIDFEATMNIKKDTYQLRSVVFSETLSSENTVITGSSSAIVPLKNGLVADYMNNVYYYNPVGAGRVVSKQDATGAQQAYKTKPFDTLRFLPENEDDTDSFYGKASRNGVLFIYEKLVFTGEQADR